MLSLKLKLIFAGLLFLTGLGIGIKVTSNHYQAQHAKALKKALAKQDKQHEKDLALARSKIKEREVIRYKTRTIIKKVRNAKVKSCPKLPDDYVRLYNESLKR